MHTKLLENDYILLVTNHGDEILYDNNNIAVAGYCSRFRTYFRNKSITATPHVEEYVGRYVVEMTTEEIEEAYNAQYRL